MMSCVVSTYLYGAFHFMFGAIALSYPPLPFVFDDSSWKNVAESFTVALTLTLGGYESAIAPCSYHVDSL